METITVAVQPMSLHLHPRSEWVWRKLVCQPADHLPTRHHHQSFPTSSMLSVVAREIAMARLAEYCELGLEVIPYQ